MKYLNFFSQLYCHDEDIGAEGIFVEFIRTTYYFLINWIHTFNPAGNEKICPPRPVKLNKNTIRWNSCPITMTKI